MEKKGIRDIDAETCKVSERFEAPARAALEVLKLPQRVLTL